MHSTAQGGRHGGRRPSEGGVHGPGMGRGRGLEHGRGRGVQEQSVQNPSASVEAILDQQESVGRRLARLQALSTHLDALTQAATPPWLPTLIQQLLPLLLDPSSDVRKAAAPTIASLGCKLVSLPAAPAPPGAPPVTVLFDWAASILIPAQLPPKPLPTPYQVSILSAISEALQALHLQQQVPVRWASAVSALDQAVYTCVGLLEANSTGPALLPSILQTLRAAIDTCNAWTSASALQTASGTAPPGTPTTTTSPLFKRCTDIVDLLLGWSLDLSIDAADRERVHEVFAALKPYLHLHRSFALDLAGNMVADLISSATLPAASSSDKGDTLKSAQATKALRSFVALLASFVAVLRSTAPVGGEQLLLLLPQLLTALHNALRTFTPASHAPTDVDAACAVVAPADHAALVTAACAAVQQLLPAMRDGIEHISFVLPVSASLAVRLQQPCLAGAASRDTAGNIPETASSSPSDVLPEVRAIVQAAFARVRGAPVANCSMQATPPAAAPTDKNGVVVWASQGCMELLLQMLCSPWLQPTLLRPVLSAAALVLAVAAGADVQQCSALALDPRLFGAHACKADAQLAWAGVWQLRAGSSVHSMQAAASLVCDVLCMPGEVADVLLREMLQELSSLAASGPPNSSTIQIISFNLATLQAACTRGAFSLVQASQVASCILQLLTSPKNLTPTPAADTDTEQDQVSVPANSSLLPAPLVTAAFNLWRACHELHLQKGRNGSSARSNPAPQLSEMVSCVGSILDANQGQPALVASAHELLNVWLRQLVDSAPAPSGSALKLEAVLVHKLLSLLRSGAIHHSEDVRLGALRAAFSLAALHSVLLAADVGKAQAPSLGKARTGSGSGRRQREAADAAVNVKPGVLDLDPLWLPLQLSSLGISCVNDTSDKVAAAALTLVVSVSDAPLAALASPASCGGALHSLPTAAGSAPLAREDVMGSARSALGAPAWHDAVALRPHTLALRPPQFARLFELLFQEAAPGGLLLRRRAPDAVTSSQEAGAAQPGAANQSAADHLLAGSTGGSAGGWNAWHLLAVSLQPADSQITDGGVQQSGSSPFGPAADIPSSSCPAVAPSSTNAAELAWTVIQEAAKQCVASRLRTHLGGPTQSFGGLEKLLQLLLMRISPARPAASSASATAPVPASGIAPAAAQPSEGDAVGAGRGGRGGRAARVDVGPGRGGRGGRGSVDDPRAAGESSGLAPAANPAAPAHPPAAAAAAVTGMPPPTQQACWLVLEFVGALERCIHHACEGHYGHAPLHRAVMAFFATNRKVCEDWFMRSRELLLHIASASGAYHAAILHGWQRLGDLKAVAKALQQQQQQQAAAAFPGAAGNISATSSGGASVIGSEATHTSGRAPLIHTNHTPSPTPTVLVGSGKAAQSEQASNASTTGAEGSGAGAAAGPTAGPEAIRARLIKDVVDALRMTAVALLACEEAEALQGLHAWASKSFGFLLRPSDASAAAAPESNGVVASKGASTDPVAAAEAAAASKAGMAAGGNALLEDPLVWLLGMSMEAQGRYEQALQRYTIFLRQQHYSPAAGLGVVGSSRGGSSIAPLGSLVSLQPYIVERAADCYAALADWSGFHGFVASQHRRAKGGQQAAAGAGSGTAGASRSDGSGSSTAQTAQGPTQGTPGNAAAGGNWWSLCAQGPHMQSIFALASFDVVGPTSHELQAFKLPPPAAGLVRGLQALHIAQVQDTEGGGQGHGSTVDPHALQLAAAPAVGALGASWPGLHSALRNIGLSGLHPPAQRALIQLSTLSRVAQSLSTRHAAAAEALQRTPLGAATRTTDIAHLLLSSLAPLGGPSGSEAAGAPQLSVGRLALPSAWLPGPPLQPARARLTGTSSLLLTNVLRVHAAAQDPVCASPTSHVLLLALALGARHTNNTELCLRTFDRLAALLPVAGCTPLRASAAAARASVLGEVGSLPPEQVSVQQVAALTPFLILPRAQLAAIAADAAAARAGAMPVSATSVGLFAVPTPAAGVDDLAASFLSLAHWLLRVPPHLQPQPPTPPPKTATEVPLASASWHMVLRTLSTPASPMANPTASSSAVAPSGLATSPNNFTILSPRSSMSQSPHAVATSPRAGALASPGKPATSPPGFGHLGRSPSRPVTSSGSSSSVPPTAAPPPLPIVPMAVASVHAAPACACLYALTLAPRLARGWLQWGQWVLSWVKELKAGGPGSSSTASVMAPHATRSRVSSVLGSGLAAAAGVGADQLEASVAGVHALCTYLQLACSQGEVSDPEDAVPTLLRILQVLVRHGHVLHASLASHLQLCPPGVWQAVMPQLFAQLHHPQQPVRQLVLGLLRRVAGAAPFAVLYPALAEVATVEAAGGEVQPELQELLHGLDAAQPQLTADVRTLMVEAERLTVTWQERWHALLSELEVDVSRRCVTLRAEAERIAPAASAPSTATVGTTTHFIESGAAARKEGATASKAKDAPAAGAVKRLGKGTIVVGPAGAGRALDTGAASVGAGGRVSTKEVVSLSGEQRAGILSARYSALMSPVVLVLERTLRGCAACEPQTPAETQFAREVLPQLTAAVAAFKSPSPQAIAKLSTQPQVCWEPLKEVLTLLSKALRAPHLDLRQVCPALLAVFEGGALPMPGLMAPGSTTLGQAPHQLPGGEASACGYLGNGQGSTERAASPWRLARSPLSGSGEVLICGAAPTAAALPTKTRPKRLVLRGSDGADHVFLLKGRDDLRMDERLMQVMRLTNGLLRADRQCARLVPAGLSVRHYSVTPLGDRVGLVQWVGSTVSIFSLFKGWQTSVRERHEAVAAARKEALAAGAGSVAGSSSGGVPAASVTAGGVAGGLGGGAPGAVGAPHIPGLPALPPMATTTRPIDMFYARLLPALRAEGVAGMVPRRQWPLPALRKVYDSLTRDTPADLIWHQLVGSSGSAARWWAAVQAYSLSMAAASCAGYLIGLGDRHLDNLLLDTSSGGVVHIDYAVCFERGTRLRVPEVVPFRLTRSLCGALGPAGVVDGGSFRAALESVLGALRTRREAMVGLLDAVLGDATVGWWAAEREGTDGHGARGLELAVALQLFGLRMAEAQEPLKASVEGPGGIIQLVEGPGGVVCAYVEAHAYLSTMQAVAEEARKRAAQAQAAQEAAAKGEAEARAALDTALAARSALLEEASMLRAAGGQLVSECSTWARQHAQILTTVRDQSLPEISATSSSWKAQDAGPALMLLSPFTTSTSRSSVVLVEALGAAAASPHIPQMLLDHCTSLDAQGAALLAARDELISTALPALSAYGAVLRSLLPPSYPEQSHHHRWGAAVAGAMAAWSMDALKQAKQLVSQDPPAETAAAVWRALRSAHALGATAMSEARSSDPVPSALLLQGPVHLAMQQVAAAQARNAAGSNDAEAAAESAALDLVASIISADEGAGAAVPGCQPMLALSLQRVFDGIARRLQHLQGAVVVACGWGGEDGGVIDTDADAAGSTSDAGPKGGATTPASGQFRAQSGAGAGPVTTEDLVKEILGELAGLQQLLQLLDRLGLVQQLVNAQVQSSMLQVQPSKAQLDQGVWAALKACSCAQVAVRLLQADCIPDLAAHIKNGATPVLEQTATAMRAVWSQVEGLLWEAWGLHMAMQQYQGLLDGGYERQSKDLQQQLARLATRAVSLDADQAAPAQQVGVEQQQQQLAARLQELQTAWVHRDANLRDMQHRQQQLHAAVASCLNHFYHLTLGPTHAGMAAASSDSNLTSQGLTPSTEAASLDAMISLLNQALPQPAYEPWGALAPYHIIGSLTAVMLQVHDASAALAANVRDAAPTASSERAGELRLPPLLAPWRSRLEAVRGVLRVLDVCMEVAASANPSIAPSSATADNQLATASPAHTSKLDGLQDAVLSPAIASLLSATVLPVVAHVQHLSAAAIQLASDREQAIQVQAEQTATRSVADHTTTFSAASTSTAILDGPQSASHEAQLPELVPFNGFEGAAPGGGLELEGELGGSMEDEEDAVLQGMGDMTDLWADDDVDLADLSTLVADGSAAVTAAEPLQDARKHEGSGTAVSSDNGDPAPAASAVNAAAGALQHSVQEVVSALQDLVAKHGANAIEAASKDSAGLTFKLQQHVNRHQDQRLHHLAAFTWLHEHLIMQVVQPGEEPPGRELHTFFQHSAWDPLEPRLKLPISTRQQLVVTLQSLCEQLPRIDDGLRTWEDASTSAVTSIQQALQGRPAASLPVDLPFAAKMLQGLLHRRHQWLQVTRDHGTRLAQACAHVVQFEISRQGAAWAPGSPLVTEAFANCSLLLQQVEHVCSSLAAVEADASRAEAAAAQHNSQAVEAAYMIEATRVEEESATSQFQVNLPMLVAGSIDLAPTVEQLANALPAALPLLTKDVGMMLKELAGVTAHEHSARDVSALAQRVLQHHTHASEVLEQLASALPVMQQELAAAAKQVPLPAGLHAELQAGRLPESPEQLAVVGALGQAMLTRLEPVVQMLQPCMHNILEVAPTMHRLLADLESLAAAASSVAAAIQSEHALSDDAAAADEGELVEKGGSALVGVRSPPEAVGSGTPPPVLGAVAASSADAWANGTRCLPRARAARRAWMGIGRSGTNTVGADQQQQVKQDAKRRAFVAGALRRCIIKLEGRDTWEIAGVHASGLNRPQQSAKQQASLQPATTPLSVSQQVDMLVRHATSPDNLCHMYEGWMPWI